MSPRNLISPAFHILPFVIVLVFVCFGVEPASGGGYKIQDQSTRAMGMIDAFVASADDASAVYYNPAGLTRLKRPEIIGNLYSGWTYIDYDGVAGDTSSENPLHVLPNLYYGTPILEESGLYGGIGVYSPFGRETRWGSDTPMGKMANVTEIELANINPTLAWQATEKLSLGGGVDYYVSRAQMEFYLPRLRGAEQRLSGDGDGLGFNLGLQYEFTPTTTFGLTYRSQVIVDYDGEASGFPTSLNAEYDLNTEIEYPALISGALSWQATEKLRMEFAAEYADWSTRDQQTFVVNTPRGTTIRRPAKWEDSWVLMLGSEYELNDKWTLRGGYGYNETPVPSSTAEPSLPAGDAHAVSAGVGYQYTENLSLDGAVVLAYSEEKTVDNPQARNQGYNINGDYEAMSTFVSFGVKYKF